MFFIVALVGCASSFVLFFIVALVMLLAAVSDCSYQVTFHLEHRAIRSLPEQVTELLQQ